MTREITHMKAFLRALDSLGLPTLQIGLIPPTPGLVDRYFNDSTGEGENGATDLIGPWNDDKAFRRVDSPAFHPDEIEADGPHTSATKKKKKH